MITLRKGVTLEAVQSSKSNTIYYSSRSIWWTDDPDDLQGDRGGIPLDIFGAPLFEAPKKDWMKAALSKPDHYGDGGLETLMASHHKNMEVVDEDKNLFTNFRHLNIHVAVQKKVYPSFTLLKSIALLVCMFALQGKAQTLFLARNVIDTASMKDTIMLQPDSMLLSTVTSIGTLVLSGASGDITTMKIKVDTTYVRDTIRPGYIIGINNKNNSLFIFGAKYLIHKYGLVSMSHSILIGQGLRIRESYHIIGASQLSLDNLDVMFGYMAEGELTLIGIDTKPIKGVKLGNRKIKVLNNRHE